MDPALSKLTENPGYLLSRVGTAVQAGFKDVLAGWDIRPTHYLLLVVLDGAAGTSQQELCTLLGIDSGNMVELLDRLEDLGYAKRAPDRQDRRRHVVRITATGRKALHNIIRDVDAYTTEFLEPLDEDDRVRLAQMLGRLYARTAEAGAPGSGLNAAPAARVRTRLETRR